MLAYVHPHTHTYIYIYICYTRLFNRFNDGWALIIPPPCSITEDDANPISAKDCPVFDSGKVGLFEDSINSVGRCGGPSNDDLVTYLVSTGWVTELQGMHVSLIALTTIFCSRVCVVHYVARFVSYPRDEPVLHWVWSSLTLQIIPLSL